MTLEQLSEVENDLVDIASMLTIIANHRTDEDKINIDDVKSACGAVVKSLYEVKWRITQDILRQEAIRRGEVKG